MTTVTLPVASSGTSTAIVPLVLFSGISTDISTSGFIFASTVNEVVFSPGA